MPAVTPLGERIRRARKRLGLSQQDLADLIGVDRKTVHNWEQGHTTRLSRVHLHALEQHLGPLDGSTEDLLTIVETIRGSSEFTAGQKQALLCALDGRPRGRHTL